MARNSDASMAVHRQWASRPADERHLSLIDLHKASQALRQASADGVVKTHDLNVITKGEDLAIVTPKGIEMRPNNWAARQMAALSGLSLEMLSRQPSALAAQNLNWGLRDRENEEVKLLVTRGVGAVATSAPWEMRAMTGPKYGRIWNDEMLAPLIEKVGDGVTGQWRVPGIRGTKLDRVTKENTTIFGGQQDFFVFLADEENRVMVKGRRGGKDGTLARGFYYSNSEVGSGKARIGFYLYDFLCANRIIWGMEDFIEIAIRHSANAPWRWLHEAMPRIEDFVHTAARPMEAQIKAAQSHMLGTGDRITDFLNRRFTKSQTINMMAVHVEEEGRPVETRWDAVTAATAYAKSIPFQNERFAVERKAGEMLA